MPFDPSTYQVSHAADHDLILTHTETAKLMRLSIRSLDRLCEVGLAPPRIKLSNRRYGYWKSDVLAWLHARTSPAKRAA